MAENEYKVVPLDEVETKFTEIQKEYDSLKRDLGNLKTEMEQAAQKTGLAIEERSDDLQKALTGMTDIQERLEKLQKAQQTNEFLSTFGNTANELKSALEEFQVGFVEFDGDAKGREIEAGSRPSIKHIVEGAFTNGYGLGETSDFIAPRHVEIARLQKAADAVYAADAMSRYVMDEGQLEEYRRKGGARSLKVYRQYAAIRDNFVKAVGDLIDTGTEVANWIPTQYSSSLYEKIKLGLPLMGMFREIAMDAPTVVLPLNMNDHEALRVTQTTTLGSSGAGDPWQDAYFNNPTAFASAKITFVAEKLRARYWMSEEASEDSIVALLSMLQNLMVRNIGEAIEDAIYNGQVTGDIDTGGTHFGKSNPVSSYTNDARYCWDGIRYHASVYTGSPSTSADQSNAKPTVVALRGLRAAMKEIGTNPANLAYILGPIGSIKLLDDTNVLTLDKLGPNATIRTGSLAQVDGVDVIVSRRVPENANASGVIDGTTTNRSMASCVHTDAYLVGNRRRITLGQQQWLASDTTELAAFWRGDVQPVYPMTTTPAVGHLYNVSTS